MRPLTHEYQAIHDEIWRMGHCLTGHNDKAAKILTLACSAIKQAHRLEVTMHQISYLDDKVLVGENYESQLQRRLSLAIECAERYILPHAANEVSDGRGIGQPMETNTNDNEAKQPALAGCHPTTCSACGGAGFTEDFETMTISGVCGECYQSPAEGEGVSIEREECDHWKERAEGILREWIDTVQTVDAGVYGDMIDETLQFLQNASVEARK